METNQLLVEEQNGFRQGRSCQDHIFVLYAILDEKIKNKKCVYSCFVDLSSAFDFLKRNLLFYALENIGVNDKFLQVMMALYTNTKSAVKINNHITPWFTTKSK